MPPPEPPPNRPVRGRWPTLIGPLIAAAVALVAGLALAAAVALPMLQRYREAARRDAAAENLRQLGTAIDAYHRRHGTPDPALPAD